MDQRAYSLLQKQLELQKKQLLWTRVAAAVFAVILLGAAAVGIGLKSKLDKAIDGLGGVALQAEEILTTLGDAADRLDRFSEGLGEIDLQTISRDLNDVSRQLAEIQWQSLAENIDDTAVAAQKSLNKAMDAIDELDIEGLNEAIEELHTVVEPLANIVKRLS